VGKLNHPRAVIERAANPPRPKEKKKIKKLTVEMKLHSIILRDIDSFHVILVSSFLF
jgi:hypothetical protein